MMHKCVCNHSPNFIFRNNQTGSASNKLTNLLTRDVQLFWYLCVNTRSGMRNVASLKLKKVIILVLACNHRSSFCSCCFTVSFLSYFCSVVSKEQSFTYSGFVQHTRAQYNFNICDIADVNRYKCLLKQFSIFILEQMFYLFLCPWTLAIPQDSNCDTIGAVWLIHVLFSKCIFL